MWHFTSKNFSCGAFIKFIKFNGLILEVYSIRHLFVQKCDLLYLDSFHLTLKIASSPNFLLGEQIFEKNFCLRVIRNFPLPEV